MSTIGYTPDDLPEVSYVEATDSYSIGRLPFGSDPDMSVEAARATALAMIAWHDYVARNSGVPLFAARVLSFEQSPPTPPNLVYVATLSRYADALYAELIVRLGDGRIAESSSDYRVALEAVAQRNLGTAMRLFAKRAELPCEGYREQLQ